MQNRYRLFGFNSSHILPFPRGLQVLRFHLAFFIISSIILNWFRPKKSYDDSYYRSLPDRIGLILALSLDLMFILLLIQKN